MLARFPALPRLTRTRLVRKDDCNSPERFRTDMTNHALAGSLDPPSNEQPTIRSLRQLLRLGTSQQHARLDRFFDGMTEIDRPDLYHRFIQMNHRCHAVLEPLLADHRAFAAVAGANRRKDLLRELDVDMRRMALSPLEAIAYPLRQIGLPEAAGIAYVLDGSRLGARFIHRDFLARDLAREWPDISTAYLEAAAIADGFREQMVDLSATIVSTRHRARALAAASAAFTLFETAIAVLPSASRQGIVAP
ncbi:MAG TPA: biliverdin-producing heme oxygenase [Aurantimonas sp.]